MESPLISVIVPIYKVEQYLPRCVDSILNQTYSNIEVILVDDGSPDNCGQICDKYAEKDSRVIVIHRVNGGLSAARNSGINICKGEYIGFVDSDDCIHPQMYELLLQDIQKYNTLLSFCQPNMCYNQIINPIELTNNTKSHDISFIYKKCLIDNIWWSACSKLYHRSLFVGIRYPEGRTNEDYPVTMRIYDKCNNIAVNYNKLYNYCIRQGSIVRSSFSARRFDQIYSSKDVYDYMKSHHPEFESPAQKNLLASCIGLLMNLADQKTESFNDKKQMIYDIIHENFSSGIKNKYLTKAQKLLLTAAYIHPSAFNLIYKFKKLYIR